MVSLTPFATVVVGIDEVHLVFRRQHLLRLLIPIKNRAIANSRRGHNKGGEPRECDARVHTQQLQQTTDVASDF